MTDRLPRTDWQQRARAHEEAVDALTAGHRERRSRGETHEVEDFLFTYYPHRPGRLRRWHPGPDVILEDAAEEYGDRSGYVVAEDGSATVDVPAVVERRGRTLTFVQSLLRATLDRPAHLGCFGMHEWAMVYRLQPGEQRHEDLPLRLSQAETDRVVEGHQVRCSHYDAYRFFTAPARPRNTLSPTRESQVAMEQPGCLHAGMDLYKWAFKLSPLVPSTLTLDAFRLARETRTLDMQASPYDVTGLGLDPVPVETAAGKAEYLQRQRDLAARSNALRRRMLDVLDPLTPDRAAVSPAVRPRPGR